MFTGSVIHRLLAVGGVALSLALCVLSVRPDLHEALCHHHRDAMDHPNATGQSDEYGTKLIFDHG